MLPVFKFTIKISINLPLRNGEIISSIYKEHDTRYQVEKLIGN